MQIRPADTAVCFMESPRVHSKRFLSSIPASPSGAEYCLLANTRASGWGCHGTVDGRPGQPRSRYRSTSSLRWEGWSLSFGFRSPPRVALAWVPLSSQCTQPRVVATRKLRKSLSLAGDPTLHTHRSASLALFRWSKRPPQPCLVEMNAIRPCSCSATQLFGRVWACHRGLS